MMTSWLLRSVLICLYVVGSSMCGVLRGDEDGLSLHRHRRSIESIDESLEEQIVSLHNTLRGQEGASDMAALSWDADLAGQASCTATSGTLSVLGADNDTLVSDLSVTFDQQKAAFDHAQLTCSIASCDIYLQVVWAAASKVGCSSVTCGNDVNVVCVYDASVTTGVAPYMTGTACTNCPSALSQCIDGLCSTPPTTTTTTTTTSTTTTTTPTTTTTTATTTTPTTTTTTPTTTTTTTPTTTTTTPTTTTTATTTTPTTTTTTPTTTTTATTTTPTTTTTETTTTPTTTSTTTTATTTTSPTTTTMPTTTTTTLTTTTTPTTTTPTTTTATTTTPTTTTATTTVTTTTAPENTQTIDAPDEGVHVLLTSPQVVRDNRVSVERTLRQESASILNAYCCQHPGDCCGEPGVDVNITDCGTDDFISESGIRLGQNSLVDRTVDDIDVLVYQLVAVTKADNAICSQVEQAQESARKKRAIDDDEMLVPRAVLQAALETSEDDLSDSLSDLGVEVSVQLDLPEVTETPMFPVWGWALVGIGGLIVLSQFVIIAMVCVKRRASKFEDSNSSDSASRYDSKTRLFSKQNQQQRDSGQSGNSGSSDAEGVGALRYSSRVPWGNGHPGGKEMRGPIRNYPVDGNREPYVPRAQRHQREPQYGPDVGYPWGRPGHHDYGRNWGGDYSVGDHNIGQGIFPQF